MSFEEILRRSKYLKIRTKMMLLGVGTILLTTLIIMIVGIWQGSKFSGRAHSEAEKLIDADLIHITENIYGLIKAQDESIQQKVNHDLKVANYVLHQQGKAHLSSEAITWTAINQFTHTSFELNLPKMMVGQTWLGHNSTMDIKAPVVDEVKSLVGGTATIFQRMNNAGDMLRVATNVKQLDGTRAIGTYIPAVNPDGTPNPVISAVMKGETYRGNAFVVNAWYVTAYEPIRGHDRDIIGMLYVGVKHENVASLREAISQVRIGKTGYVFVLGGEGNDRGHYIISKNGERDGEDLWNTRDADGRLFIQSMIQKAVVLKPGEFATERYSWKNPDEPLARLKIARLAYYKPWNWIIGASVYEDELQGSLRSITTGYGDMIGMFGVVAIGLALFGGAATWLFARKISQPLLTVTEAATKLTEDDLPRLVQTMRAVNEGDLTVTFQFEPTSVTVDSGDELHTMALAFTSMSKALGNVGEAFNQMIANLRNLTGHLEQRVAERTTELSQANEYLQREITEHQHATQALQKSEELYTKLVATLPDVVVRMDIEGNILFVNDFALQMSGYRSEELIGRSMTSLIAPEDCEKAVRNTLLMFEQRLGPQEYYLIMKDGRKLLFEVSADVLRTEGGAPYGIVCVCRDITIRKRAEEALKEAKETAESATQAKSAFLATMSHEIRTPMNAVIGMTSLLLDTPLSAEQREFAETIRISGDGLLSIINDILDFSKIDAGRMEMERQPFDLRECVEGAIDLLAMRAVEKNLNLVYLMDERVPPAVIGDVTRVRQILVNLLSNAVKFTEKGDIEVGVDCPDAGAVSSDQTDHMQPPPVTLCFSVKDSGIGIPAERMDRLFKSFSQVDAFTSRRYGGTGLGLIISKRLAELMGGGMQVESEVGRGSTFSFTIRAQATSLPKHADQKKTQVALRGKRVLIVDDNATNRRILMLQTQGWGMVPQAATSPFEALEWIRKGDPFDLAILDMQMPDMDGIALTSEIRKLRDAQTMPLIMLSSLGQREVGMEDAYNAYLTKPVKASQLYNILIGIMGMEVAPTAEEKPLFDAEMANKHPLRILLAEDNAINQKLALQLLKRMGYRADVAGNGLEAIEALRRQPYDVVLMDIQMPEMDGLEASCTICREWPREHRPRIVAMTANVMSEDREACSAAGMDGFIGKPIRVEELADALYLCKPAKE